MLPDWTYKRELEEKKLNFINALKGVKPNSDNTENIEPGHTIDSLPEDEIQGIKDNKWGKMQQQPISASGGGTRFQQKSPQN